MKKVWVITAIFSLGFGVALLMSMLSSDKKYIGKHRFKVNQLVKSRFTDEYFLILDTLRDDDGKPSYKILKHEDMLDVEFSYTENKTTNY